MSAAKRRKKTAAARNQRPSPRGQRPQSAIAPTTPRDHSLALAALLLLAGTIVYGNSFAGVFVFDDFWNIVESTRIRSFDNLWGRRFVVSLSLAVNYRLGALDPFGYHLVNLLVHLSAGLILFDLLRRTLRLERFGDTFARSAPWLACTVSLIWIVHPLQTQSVTYIIQRGESLMGLFYLLAIYCLLRGATSGARWTTAAWYAGVVVACGLGMGSKAVIVTAPLAILLYDLIFLTRSLKQTLKRRWGLYAFMILFGGAVFIFTGLAKGILAPDGRSTAGFGVTTWTVAEYALTQPAVILHYLRLSLIPTPLCLDYWWRASADVGEAAVSLTTLFILLLATAWLLWKRPAVGFLAVMFFLILSPTSSVVPVQDVAVEHRMYLPLAAVIALLVFGGHHLLCLVRDRFSIAPSTTRWIAAGLVVAVTATYGFATIDRNRDYHSELRMWSDVVTKRPLNHRARTQLGKVLADQGRIDEAIEQYRHSLATNPMAFLTHTNLGKALADKGQIEEAIYHYEQALELDATYEIAHNNLGNALLRLGRVDEAMEHFRQVKRGENLARRFNSMGVTLAQQGKMDKATKLLRRAVEREPDYAEAHSNLGNALSAQGQTDEAIDHYREAIRLQPDFVDAHLNLALTLQQQGRIEEAIPSFRETLRLQPALVEARYTLGQILLLRGNIPEAIEEFRRVLEIQPGHSGARQAMDMALARLE